MKFILSLITLIAFAIATPTQAESKLTLIPVIESALIPTADEVAVAVSDGTTPCVCTAPFRRWPWSSTWYRQCYNTGGDHEIWDEAGSCDQSSCFPSNQCGATPSASILSIGGQTMLATTSNDISKYQEAEVVAGCTCPQDWFWQPGWIWGGYWVRQCFETRGDDIFPFNYIDQSSQSNKPTYNPCN